MSDTVFLGDVRAEPADGCGTGPYGPEAVRELLGRVQSLEEELALHRARSEAHTAQEMYDRAQAFIAGNPAIWERITDDAAHAVMMGRRFSLKKEIEILRDSEVIQDTGESDYRLDNSVTAALTRFLLRAVPGLHRHCTVHRSKVDRLFPESKELRDGQ